MIYYADTAHEEFEAWLSAATDNDCNEKAHEIALKCASFGFVSVQEPLRFAISSGWLHVGAFGFDDLSDEAVSNMQTKERKKLLGIVKRINSGDWWVRQLRRRAIRAQEATEVRWGYVGRIGSYLSNRSLDRMIHRKQKTDVAIKHASVISPDGEAFDLEKIIEASVANPRIKRLELIVRNKGMAEVAQRRGFIGFFITLTAPSSFHRLKTRKNKAGDTLVENAKWNKSTPAETQKYLTKCWAQFRAQLKKSEIEIIGTRTVEPHKDGTPHWHLVLYCSPKNAHNMLKKLKEKFLEKDGNESGAKQRRVTIKRIKTEKGKDLAYCAVAYCIAYISKNLDGSGLDVDVESGVDAVTGAQRATAWARLWGIRQFQTFGAPSITVWRELRRVRDEAIKAIQEVAKSEETAIAEAAKGLLAGNVAPCAIAATEAMKAGRADVLDRLTAMRDLHLSGEIQGDGFKLGEAWAAADEGQFRRFMDAMEKSPIGLSKRLSINAYGETVETINGLIAPNGEIVITREEGWSIQWGAKKVAVVSTLTFEAQPRSDEAKRNRLGPVALTVTSGSNYENRQRGVEHQIREIQREKGRIRKMRAGSMIKYSYYEASNG